MLRSTFAFVLAAAIAPIATEPASVQSTSACQPAGKIIPLAGLPEASGLAASLTTAGRLWSHNDSGKPEIVSLDTSGQVTGRVAVSGAAVVDWEAIAPARCGGRPCLFIGDIGDNNASRRNITIYRIADPAAGASSVRVDAVIRATYPDGAQDAEALLATPDGTLYIVTKGETGPVALYRLRETAGGDVTTQLERVGTLGKGRAAARITDGAISPDGDVVLLRTRDALTFYRAADFLKGEFRAVRSVDLRSLREPQGEGVAFGPRGTVYLAGEGGGKSQAGTLAVLSCSM